MILTVESPPNKIQEKIQDIEKKANENRCYLCTRKLKLVDKIMGKCKCQHFFCHRHLYPEQHECLYDYQGDERKRLQSSNPQIKKKKLEPI